ncbi:MAG: hypothetical protein PHO12_00820 [Bacteroidales bacterium]|nr:hypothetical protein [Bacteroidales bacterium]MDD4684455.1 hypothetical protein [Bacteroidales bacterium]
MKQLFLILMLISITMVACSSKEEKAKELIKQEWDGKDVKLFLNEPYKMFNETIDKSDNSLIGYELLYRVRWNDKSDTIYYKASFDKELTKITNNTNSILESEKQILEESVQKGAEVDSLIDVFNVLH